MSGTGMTMAEVAKHNDAQGKVLVVIKDNVYDVTDFAGDHPGGKGQITRRAGTDATTDFTNMHNFDTAIKVMEQFLVGPVLPEGGGAAGKPELTVEEVSKHKSADSMWVIIKGHVYDVTKFAADHPGGEDQVADLAGQDATEDFEMMHDFDSAIVAMEPFKLGPVVAGGSEKKAAPEKKPASKVEATRNKYKCVASTNISADTKRVSFVACEGEKVSPDALPPGGHMVILFEKDDKEVRRNYTPVVHKPGEFELIVKAYEDGKGSQLIHSLEAGKSIAAFNGPIAPSWNYLHAKEGAPHNGQIKTLILIAGGTGVAPMYSIAEAALRTHKPFAGKVLFFGCFKDEEDILMEDEVVGLADIGKPKPEGWMSLALILSRQKDKPLEKKRDFAVFTERVTGEHLVVSGVPSMYQAGTEVVACGPPAFNTAVGKIFSDFSYPKENVHLM